MKKGEIYEGTVEKTEFPNRGIIKAEERRIIVKNTIPGQKIRYRIRKLRKGTGEGQLLEVLEPSPLETEPACPHFGQCGGCTYQNLPYEEQLRLKESQLRELLDGAVWKPYMFEGVKESPRRLANRTKKEFSFGDEVKDGPLALGMHKRGGFYDIVTTDQCQIVDEDYRKILSCTLQYFQEQGLSFYHRLRHTGYLRHLLVRKGAKTGEILVDLVTTTQLSLPRGAEAKAENMQQRLRSKRMDFQLLDRQMQLQIQIQIQPTLCRYSRFSGWMPTGQSCCAPWSWMEPSQASFIHTTTVWLMWFRMTGQRFCMGGTISMKSFWDCVLRFPRFPFSRRILWGLRSFTAQPETMSAIRRTV